MNVGGMLAAKSAADSRRHHSDLCHRLAELFGDALLNVMHRLAGGVERDASGRIHVGHASVRFEVEVVLRLRLPDAFDDHVAFRERALDVAFFDRAFEHDIVVSTARDGFDVARLLLMQERGIGCQRCVNR